MFTDADVYDAAADVIRRRGLVKGKYFDTIGGENDGTCAVCADGALWVVVSSMGEAFSLSGKIADHTGIEHLPRFNDRPSTTAQDIIDLFESYATYLRSEA